MRNVVCAAMLGVLSALPCAGMAQTQPPAPRFLAFTFANDKLGWAAGDGIAITRDGGHSWQMQYAGGRVDSVMLVRKHALFALAAGTVLHSADDGAHWDAIATPSPALTSLAFASDRHAFGIGADKLLYASDDGAVTWHRASFAKPVDAVCFSDARHGYVGGATTAPALGAFDGVARTGDGGATWTTATRPPTEEIVGIASHTLHCTPRAVFDLIDLGAQPGGDAYVFARSTDGARRWSVLALGGQAKARRGVAQGPGNEATSMTAYDRNTAAVAGFCGACRPQAESALGATGDGGRSWHNTPLGHVGVTSAPVFVSRSHGWLGARTIGGGGLPTGDEVLETRDGGRSWSTVFTSPVVPASTR